MKYAILLLVTVVFVGMLIGDFTCWMEFYDCNWMPEYYHRTFVGVLGFQLHEFLFFVRHIF